MEVASYLPEKSLIKMPSYPLVNQAFDNHLDSIKKQIFQPFRTSKCNEHILQKQLICLDAKCSYANKLICKDCNHCNHELFPVNKLVPMLSEWINKQNQQVQKQNKKLFQEWKIVSTNIEYVIQILTQLLQVIQNHTAKKLFAPKNFIEITENIFGMFTHDYNNASAESFLKNIQNFQNKFNIFKIENNQNENSKASSWQSLICQKLQDEKNQRLKQSLKASLATKKFSEKALAFTQTLAELIEDKIKQKQTKSKLQVIKQKNELCLRDLIDNPKSYISEQSPEVQKIDTFSIELPLKDGIYEPSAQDIQKSLGKISKLKNLKQLRINNKNGRIDHRTWYHILNYVQMLKFLKDLKLVLTSKDLQMLQKLFSQKQKALRQVEGLTLQITDQSQLQLSNINKFISTMQLRRLTLILSRNNFPFKKIVDFIKGLKVYTSLSKLPLIECNISMAANKTIIYNDQKNELDTIFKQKCKDVKIKSLLL